MTQTGWVGRSVPRKEDHRLLIGRGQFLADLALPGALAVVFVRSERAHAHIRAIDTAEARAMPGVVTVVTWADIAEAIKPLPQPVVTLGLEAKFPTHWPLARDRVRFHGEPVAAVVARDRYCAEDAAEAVAIDYEDLPYVGSAEAALAEGAPPVHEAWADNEQCAVDFTGGDAPADHSTQIDGLIRTADVVIDERFSVHRCGVTPLETRGALALWDTSDGLTCWLTTQRPHMDRLALADVLGLDSTQVRVIAPRDQGGGFGVKGPFYREPILVCHLARRLGRPIRWIESRQEHLMAVSQERDQSHHLTLAATRDGDLVALRTRGLADCGDGCAGYYWGCLMPILGGAMFPNAYDLPDCDISVRVAFTNKSALSPARAIGAYPTRFALERAIDILACKLGMEPVELRRRNLVRQFPHTTATGVHYDSGDFVKVLDTLVAAVDLPAFRARQKEARAGGRYLGLGVACGAELSGVSSEILVPNQGQPGYGAATVRVDPRGKALVFIGDSAQGQGHETVVAQAVAQEFGITPDDVSVQLGDTGSTPFGAGTIGSRGSSYTVSAAVEACRVLKAKIAHVLAHDRGVAQPPDDLRFADGAVTSAAQPAFQARFCDIVERIIMAPIDLPEGVSGGLEHTAFFEAAKPMIAFSAHAVILEVSAQTGAITLERYLTCEDVGTVINPLTVEGQVQGGVVQGLSNALFEEFVYDVETGQQITADFETYKLATAADVPPIAVHHASTPCPHTPLGSRGMGEGIPGPVPGALANAVCDALSPFGIEITSLPLRPDRLWHMIRAAQQP